MFHKLCFQEQNRQLLEENEMGGHQGSRPLPSIIDQVSSVSFLFSFIVMVTLRFTGFHIFIHSDDNDNYIQ